MISMRGTELFLDFAKKTKKLSPIFKNNPFFKSQKHIHKWKNNN